MGVDVPNWRGPVSPIFQDLLLHVQSQVRSNEGVRNIPVQAPQRHCRGRASNRHLPILLSDRLEQVPGAPDQAEAPGGHGRRTGESDGGKS